MSAEGLTYARREWLLDVRAFDCDRVINKNTQRLLQALKEDEIDIDNISRLLSLEPVLAAKILMICNSSFFGYPRQVTHIEEAIVILGAVKLSNLVYSSMVLVEPADSSHKNYIKHSLMTALFCRAIAEKTGLRGEVPFTAGLFHVLPVIVNYQPNIKQLLTGPVLHHAIADMLNNLNLPPEVVAAASGLYEPESSNLDAVCLRMAFNLSVIAMGKKEAAFAHIVSNEHDFNRVQLKPKELATILVETRNEQNELQEMIG